MNDENLVMESQAAMSGISLGEVIGKVSQKYGALSPREQQLVTAGGAQAAAIRATEGTLTRPQKILLKLLKNAPAAFLERIKKGTMNFKDLDYYFRKQVTVGITRILDETTKVKAGSSSIDSNTLKTGTMALIHKIRIAYANDAGVDETIPKYSNTATTPAKILAGDIVFTIGGTERLRLPVTRFFNEGGSYAGVQGNADCVDLNSPIPWYEGEDLVIQFETPTNAATLGANNHFLEVRPIMVAVSNK